MREDIAEKAEKVFAILGWTLDSAEDRWGGIPTANTPEGWRAQIRTAHERGKLHIAAWLPSPNIKTPGRSVNLGSIRVSAEKEPARIAGDILRRLVPVAQPIANEARAKWAAEEAQGEALEAVAARLGAIPHVSAKLEDKGTEAQAVSVYMSDPNGGSLSAKVYAHGSVSIRSVYLHRGNEVDRLAALLEALVGFNG